MKEVKSFIPGKSYYAVHHSIGKRKSIDLRKCTCEHVTLNSDQSQSALLSFKGSKTLVSSQFYHLFDTIEDVLEFSKQKLTSNAESKEELQA